MSIKRIIDNKTGMQCMYHSRLMRAFGPVFYKDEDISAFLHWLDIELSYLGNQHYIRDADFLDRKVDEWREEKKLEKK